MGSREEILALEERLRRGDSSPEPDTSAVFDELLHDDVLFIQAGGNRKGKTGVVLGHRPPRKRTFSKVANSGLELVEAGSAVIVSSRTEYELGTRSFALRAVRIWERTGRGWKVKAVCLMEIPEPSATT